MKNTTELRRYIQYTLYSKQHQKAINLPSIAFFFQSQTHKKALTTLSNCDIIIKNSNTKEDANMKKRILSSILSLIVVSSVIATSNSFIYAEEYTYSSSVTELSASSNAKNGWYKNSDGTKCYYVDGTKVVSKTKKIDGKIYLFDDKGILLTSGMHEVNGHKYYSDKEGRVKCNQWAASKTSSSGNTYYYAAASGRISEYSFKQASKYDKTICLYIDGNLASEEALPLNGVYDVKDLIDTSDFDEDFLDLLGPVESRCGFFKVGSHFYHLTYNSAKKRVECDYAGKTISSTYNCNNSLFYDLGSGKFLGYALGTAWFNKKGYISEGAFFNATESASYVIQDEKSERTKIARKNMPILITNFETKQNSVGGLNYTLGIVNNSGKTINYIYYTVHVINRVGDTVSCTIARDSSFRLSDTGPYKAGETTSGTWEAFMYNYSANKVVIDKVEIKYSDGTSVTLDGSKILSLDPKSYS